MYHRLYFFICLLMVSPCLLAAGTSSPVVFSYAEPRPIFQTLQLTGTITSPQSATLSASTSGLVETMLVEEGAQVKAQDALLKLDDDLVALQLKSASAQAKLATITLKDAKRRLDDAQALTKLQSISKNDVKNLETEVAKAQALLEQSLAEQGFQQELLAKHSLIAPFTGVVSRKLTEQGEWVSTGDGVLELVSTENLRIDFHVSEDYLHKIDENSKVTFSLGMSPDKSYQAKIGAIVPVLDPAARTFLLRALVSPEQKNVIPGMSVKGTLELATGREGIVVPKDALLRYPDGRIIVWTAEQTNNQWQATEHLVKTGVSFDSFIEIRKGLTANARVIIRGNEALQNGQTVSPVEEAAQ